MGCPLASLIKNSTGHRIYALNRPKNMRAEERHYERSQTAGLDLDDLTSSRLNLLRVIDLQEILVSQKSYITRFATLNYVCLSHPFLYLIIDHFLETQLQSPTSLF